MTARQRAFGLNVEAAFDLPELPARGSGAAQPDVTFELAALEDLDAAWTGPGEPPQIRETVIDSLAYRAERGSGGDIRCGASASSTTRAGC